jgi:murein DD-endopeptidase MepM/ murein hydrolase activator NlpD
MHKKDAEDTALFMTVLLAIGILLMIFAHVEAYGEEFSSPLREYVETSPPGYRPDKIGGSGMMHYGADLVPVGNDDRVYAIASGRVVSHWPAPGWYGGKYFKGDDDYGGMIIVRLDDGTQILYGHMSRTFVSERGPLSYVYSGQVIGIVGNTGKSTGKHLHIGVAYNIMQLFGLSVNRREFEKRMTLK